MNRRSFLKRSLLKGAELGVKGAGLVMAAKYTGGCISYLGGPEGRCLDYDGMTIVNEHDGSFDFQIDGHSDDGYRCSLIVRDATESVVNGFKRNLNKTQLFKVDEVGNNGYRVETLAGKRLVPPLRRIRRNGGVDVYEVGDISLIKPISISRIGDNIKGQISSITTSKGSKHEKAIKKNTRWLKKGISNEIKQ